MTNNKTHTHQRKLGNEREQ